METLAFRMKLKPGMEAEYRRRHDAIWPEMLALLRAAGISDYTIFLDRETDALFAVFRCATPDAMASLADDPIERRWNTHMADLLEVNADDSAVVVDLVPLFHMD
ncbi:MAG: L-rhamnose mutarotase [Bauldia sp.]|nr:L-rhamnose mutarotase [Bauldia sp.]